MKTDAYVPLQESHGEGDGWKVLIICVMLNMTSRDQVRPLLPLLFARFPTPEAMVKAGPDKVGEVIKTCGFRMVRGQRLVQLSRDYLADTPKTSNDVLRLHGCGHYAAEAFAIFVEGRRDLEPRDYVLKEWLNAIRS